MYTLLLTVKRSFTTINLLFESIETEEEATKLEIALIAHYKTLFRYNAITTTLVEMGTFDYKRKQS